MYAAQRCVMKIVYSEYIFFSDFLFSSNALVRQRSDSPAPPDSYIRGERTQPGRAQRYPCLAHPAASTTLPIGPNKMNPLHRVDMRSKRRVSPPAENKVVVINNLASLKAYGRGNGFSKVASQLCPGGMIQDRHLRRVPIITHLSSRSRTRVSVESNSSIRSTALV